MPPLFRRAVGCALSIILVLGVGVAFPQTPLDVDIELYYNSTWNDITEYVYHRSSAPIVIQRGRTAEGQRCDPGRMSLQLNNRDGRFSPRNPNSPLFQKIGRNTPIRVKVTYGAVTYTRFVGEVVAWPSRWEPSGQDVWVPLEAAGILRRLGQGSKPLRSPLYRAFAGIAPGDYVPHVYWPMEDGPDATVFASASSGALAIIPVGDVSSSSDSGLISSNPLPYFDTGSSATALVPTYDDADQWALQFVMKVPANPSSDVTLMEIAVAGGNVAKWRLWIEQATPDILWFTGLDALGAEVHFQGVLLDGITVGGLSSPSEADFYGSWYMWTLGSKMDIGLLYSYIGLTAGIDMMPVGGGFAGTHGSIRSITMYGNSAAGGAAFGHLAVFTDPTFDFDADSDANARAILGWDGDECDARLERLATQSALPLTVTGVTSAQMGPERTVTLLQALRDAEDVDQGFLFERRDELGLKFRTLASKYNQAPIALDYDVGHISPPFDPEPDDQNIANDREVRRRDGSSARRELTSGPLSIQDPPNGVGRYDDSITLDAHTDDQLDHIAQWRLHIGTWDAERYPRVRVDLARNTSLISSLVPADSGDLLTIDNLPAWLPPERAELIVEGYRETIGSFSWDLVFNCSPGGPYNVAGVWELMSHELHAAINSAVTSIDIASTDVSQPMLSTTVPAPGYGTKINGEEMQLTAVAASTITFGATGTAASGSDGSRISTLPTGSASGNLILIFASTRNSGTGVPDTPANWTRLPIFPATANTQVFARIYDGVWSMPTVTFTGGAVFETTIAQTCRLAGKWHDPANILIGSASCLNASAQDITYPGLALPSADNAIILYFGWKADDYTSVTSPGTEIQEASTTAGNDASQVWAYSIQTTATAVASGVFTVTGGASGISRGAVAALRCDYQTATVTRSTNGVTASHAAGDDITLTRPMRWALL